jgi:hypothetical protein
MPMDARRVEQLKLQYEQARAQYLQENGEKFEIIMRYISDDEKQRIMQALTEKREKVLFGLEAPDEGRRLAGIQPGKSGGDQTCDICGKTGLTTRGLSLHRVRVHKGAQLSPVSSPWSEEQAGGETGETEGESLTAGSSRRR